jgi:hypothetical protein
VNKSTTYCFGAFLSRKLENFEKVAKNAREAALVKESSLLQGWRRLEKGIRELEKVGINERAVRRGLINNVLQNIPYSFPIHSPHTLAGDPLK